MISLDFPFKIAIFNDCKLKWLKSGFKLTISLNFPHAHQCVLCLYMYTNMHVSLYLYLWVNVFVHVCVYVCMSECLCMCKSVVHQI